MTPLPTSPNGLGQPRATHPPRPAAGARGLARIRQVLEQLEESQWWSPERIRAWQTPRLARLLEHARSSIPFVEERLRGLEDHASPEAWGRIPILTRRDLQAAGEAIFCAAPPPSHGAIRTCMTSGSTATPIAVRGSGVTRFSWKVLTLRDHAWQDRDFSAKLATIRYTTNPDAEPPRGAKFEGWGFATKGVVDAGPCALLGINSTVDEQAAWLRRVDPAYLLTYPSIAQALAEHVLEHGGAPRRLRQVRTFGEIVGPQTRSAVRDAFDVDVADVYSAQEVGYIALQCPHTENYHAQSESLVVEVLNEDDRPCEPGEIGRVVVTTLHNFVTPLIRYEIGDLARVAAPCPCGRGLAAFSRILGRERNMLVLPDGRRRWPSLGQGSKPTELPPFQQFQVIQKSVDLIEVRVIRPGPFNDEEESRIVDYLRESLGHPFKFRFEYPDEIERHPSGKFEDFRCEIPAAGPMARS